MTAVVTYARAKLWRQWQSWLSLALLVGLAGGAVLATFAGGSRTESAYRRFAAKYHAADVMVLPPFGPGFASLDFGKVARLPEVMTSAEVDLLANDGPQSIIVPVDDKYGRTVDATKMLSGRLPRSDRPDEAAVTFDYARRAKVKAGDTLSLHFFRPASAGTTPTQVPFSIRVVGVVAAPGEFPPSIEGYFPSDVHLSRAFSRSFRGELKSFSELAVRLRRGDADVPAFEAGLHRLAGDVPVLDTRQAQQADNVQRAIHTQALALWLLGAFLGLTAALVLGQLLSRRSTLAADDHPTLRAMGMTRTQLWVSEMISAVIIGAVGGGMALAVAVLASPILPIGTARVAEPSPGVSINPLILGIGVITIMALVVILAAIPTWLATSRARQEIELARRERPSMLARAATAAGLPPTATVGVGLALTAGRGPTAVPVRSSLAGVTLAVAALATAITFGASLTHLLATPRLYGWNWDARITTNGETTTIEPFIDRLRPDPRLEAMAMLDNGVPIQVGDSTVAGLAIKNVKGHISPVVLKGREPEADDEVALGAKTARDSGAHLGGRVALSITAVELTRTPKRMVGTVVLPPTSAAGRFGVGAIITYDAEASLVPPGVQVPPLTDAAVRFAPDVDRKRLLADLRRSAGSEYLVSTPEAPTDIVNFGRVQNLPLILAGLVALLAAATLAHTLVSSVYRRARDLAVLKTLGFTAKQVRRTVAWQSTTLTSIALLVGLPAGIALGRLLWTVFANQLGTLARPATPKLSLALVIPAGVVVANLVAAIPSFLASRSKPALVLHTQ
jgi:ABC-type lipoprotein release transport system permease subunit